MTDNDITICGHGSGKPSLKNLNAYSAYRYSKKADNGVRKGIVEVRRFKAMDDAHRVLFHDTYATIIGRNSYSQTLRQYCYVDRNGRYYSDCSSSGMATLREIGYAVNLLNTAGIHYAKDWETIDVAIERGHIKNPEVLKVGDAILFAGSDPSRPMQIGHVEWVYKVPTPDVTTTVSNESEMFEMTLKTLKIGAEGDTVKALQTLLIGYGYDCGKAGADGDFGNKTAAALKSYQDNMSLVVDGVCGPKTWSKLLGV